ncbi:MAG: leucine efflux protein LeuE [Burkholderiales bacterium]|nr:leucine efflux protein LeuE [Burkholderiales bacterium]
MLGITDLATYVIGTIFIILLPGPNSLYVLAVAAKRGVRPAYASAAGVLLGDAVLMVLAAAGVGTLLKAYPSVFLILKLAGAAYLAWIGAKLILAAVQRYRTGAPSESDPVETPDAANPFARAFAICMVNPKAILFFVSFFIQFVDPAYGAPVVTFAALGVIFQFFSILYLSALIFAGARIADAFRRRFRLSSVMTGAVGALFIGFGARLATATVE